jgi:radical SAM/Cys-rich protein
MTRETVQWCLEAISESDIQVLDITGGAPELNPNFRWLVEKARRLGREVIDRSNLTVLTLPGFTDLPEFLAQQGTTIVASLPCYLGDNVDAQRGQGTFDRSIFALQRLNSLGYGQPDSGLSVNLVYNPLGPALPSSQETLEAIYRQELSARYGVVFNRLLTLTNAPIGRFRSDLLRTHQYESYMNTLARAFNPAAAANVMCRTMLSVDWTGQLHDCDFNQMLAAGLEEGRPQHIRDFDLGQLTDRQIVTGEHCYACTAGTGSGCQGALVQLTPA